MPEATARRVLGYSNEDIVAGSHGFKAIGSDLHNDQLIPKSGKSMASLATLGYAMRAILTVHPQYRRH